MTSWRCLKWSPRVLEKTKMSSMYTETILCVETWNYLLHQVFKYLFWAHSYSEHFLLGVDALPGSGLQLPPAALPSTFSASMLIVNPVALSRSTQSHLLLFNSELSVWAPHFCFTLSSGSKVIDPGGGSHSTLAKATTCWQEGYTYCLQEVNSNHRHHSSSSVASPF